MSEQDFQAVDDFSVVYFWEFFLLFLIYVFFLVSNYGKNLWLLIKIGIFWKVIGISWNCYEERRTRLRECSRKKRDVKEPES